jgi:hypothetical protein
MRLTMSIVSAMYSCAKDMRSEYRKFAGLIVIAAAARAVSLQWLHPVTWDEIEFFRATKWVAQGLVPFRDFWEHHTPLQWFVFAPVAALVDSPGVAAIVALRWAQVPVWIAAFVALFLWMRDIAIGPRLAAIGLAVCSSMFMLAAVEYRIDTVGCALYIAALLLLQRDRLLSAGATLCLAGLANIRLGPLIAVTVVMVLVQRRMRGLRLVAGAAASGAIAVAYFVATNSAAIAFRSVWVDNYIGDKLAQGQKWMFLHRLAVPFGLRPIESTGDLFSAGSVDVATIAIIVLGVPALVRSLMRRDGLFTLAILQIFNVLFIAIMKFIHHYHFEIAILLMLPFVAIQLERLGPRRTMAIFAVASVVNIYAAVFRGKEDDMRYEDLIMREADARSSATVFDGVGRALRRKPAYRYWFLPALQTLLERAGRIEPYRPAELPEVVIADYRVFGYLRDHPRLARVLTSHYLPLWRNLWVPSFTSRGSGDWIAPVSGTYHVYMSEALANHAWFRHPLEVGVFDTNVRPLEFGGDLKPSSVITVKRGERIHVDAPPNFGVFVIPASDHVFFRQPARGVTLDAVAPAVTHVPRF